MTPDEKVKKYLERASKIQLDIVDFADTVDDVVLASLFASKVEVAVMLQAQEHYEEKKK